MYYQPPKSWLSKIRSHRGFIAATLIALAGAALYLFFPHGNSWDEYVLAFGAECVLPACFVWFILQRNLKEYGFGWGNRGILFNAVVLFLSLGIFLAGAWFFLSGTSLGKDFVAVVARDTAVARTSFLSFLLYTALSLWFTTCNEFFFRAFFLFTWKEFLGKMALLAHILFFGVFVGIKMYGLSGGAFEGALLLFGAWSLIASLVAFSTESVFLSFCFSSCIY